MCAPIVEEKRWQLVALCHVTRVHGIVPGLPQMPKNVKLPVFVSKKNDYRISEKTDNVAQQDKWEIE
jgi:hypothetical protein